MTDEGRGTTHSRDGWVVLGMTVSATSAMLSSFAGLYELARVAGWATIMAPLLPLTVDAFAATATRIWLAASTRSSRARRFARRCAVGAILLSLAGNAAWHLIAAQLLAVTWVIVLVVGAVPPLVLGLVSHLAVLRTQVDPVAQDEPSTVPSPVLSAIPEAPQPAAIVQADEAAVVPRPRKASTRKARPRYASEDELLRAAQDANTAYQTAHGKPITRDELRRVLRIGGERATALLRHLREASGDAANPLSIPHQTQP